MGPERIWYDAPREFITRSNWMAVIPTGSMSYAQQLNAIMRLSVYYASAIALIRGRPESFVLPVATAMVTYLLYEGSGRSEREFLVPQQARATPGQTVEGCVRPSRENPFMNLLNEEPRDREPACDPLDPEIKRDMRDKFQRDLFRDVSDVWERGNSERQFHTMPVTSLPNNQTAFAEWIYGDVRRGGRASRPPTSGSDRVCDW
jgi:hypothetical protein